MKDHHWRSYLTQEEAQDVMATEKYQRWAQDQANAAAYKISRIRNRCVKRMEAAEKKELVQA